MSTQTTPAPSDALSPVAQFVRDVRAKLAPGTLLLLRLGDFAETFGPDAETAARVLGVTLTARRGVPMAGFLWRDVEESAERLVAAGYAVAIAEELHSPAVPFSPAPKGGGTYDAQALNAHTTPAPGTTPAAGTCTAQRFGELPIGARFHLGKCRGMGARSHVLNWHEMQKEDSKRARVVVSHGDIHRTGQTWTPGRLARVFPLPIPAEGVTP